MSSALIKLHHLANVGDIPHEVRTVMREFVNLATTLPEPERRALASAVTEIRAVVRRHGSMGRIALVLADAQYAIAN